MTTRQAVLDYIRSCRHSPSVREIAAAVGIAPTSVQYHLARLERDSEITRENGRIVVK